MLRVLCGLAFVFALHNLLFAADPQPSTPAAKSRGAAWSPLRATPASVTTPAETGTAPKANPQGRKKLEALLQTVANLNYGDRETVTVQEVLDDLHRQHQLSIRFDVPTLSGLFSAVPAEPFVSQIPVSAPGPVADPNSVPTAQQSPYAPSPYPPIHQTTNKPAVAANAPASAMSAAKSPESKDPSQPAAEKAAPQPDAVPPATHPDGRSVPNANPILLSEITADDFVDVVPDLLAAEVVIKHLDLKNVTIATLLRHTLDALPAAEAMSEAGSGMPIMMTNAAIIDYIVEDDGLLITTRLNALTAKETRVYSLKNLKDVTPDQLAKVVRQSIRPWSWRSQINDLGDQLKSGLPQQLPAEITSLMTSGLQLASAASGFSVPITSCPDCERQPQHLLGPAIANQPAGGSIPANEIATATPATPPHGTISIESKFSTDPQLVSPTTTTLQPDAAATTMAVSTLVNALEVVAHAALSSLEMMHYADPPTGTIQTLPGRLIITQSQAAHREIADLIKQLEDE